MNQYDLSQKRILFVGEQTGLDNAILLLLKESMALKSISDDNQRLVVYDKLTIGDVESDIKGFVKKRPFDGVVFNIVHSDFRPLQFAKPELVSQIMNDNYAVFIEVVRALKKCRGLNDGASIVAMSSISSSKAMKAKMAFCASKAALDAAVCCLLIELALKGIRVNSIQKGAVDTDFEKSHIQNVQAIRSDEIIIDNPAPLGLVKGDEVAELVAFLLSDATRSLTGQSIANDSGYTA
jgi:NAD(P)-dependent dehydrogenase (short-subunit alcohol dehydrogenase family)